MDNDDSIDKTNSEFQEVKDELKEILFDIRCYLMEALTPIPNDMEKQKLHEELKTERR